MIAFWLMLLACFNADVLPALAPPQAEVSVLLESAEVASGKPAVVQIRTLGAYGWSFEPVIPYAEGLEVELLSEAGPSIVGERTVHTRRYALTGVDGSYVIATTEGRAVGPGEQTRDFEVTPLFVDIGVEGPTGGPMDGFAARPAVETPSIDRYIWGGLAITVALALAWWLYRRRQRQGVEVPVVPPHILAQGAWADARATIEGDHPLAVRLSMILREYIEDRAGIPASKATSAEIWEALAYTGIDGRPITESLRGHIAQILDATDRLKFARQGGGDAFFTALDQHFQTIINQTRPLPEALEAVDA